ncbi:MAG: L-2-amino-thiazoline-4-carboxylic acid hydrolase [Lachnospiraceae bacterium]|nr:L-2-amino-thiazoline-4-carboxylic acid hydrolase [Lachnospiraceae bacterium]
MNEKEIQKEIRSLTGVRKLLTEKMGEEKTAAVFADCEQRMRKAWNMYENASKEEAFHLKKIIPRACIYNSIKEQDKDLALDVILQDHREKAEGIARHLKRIMKLPGMKNIFMKAWDPLTKKMFGEKAGFKNVFYENGRNEYRMDIIQCPYCRVFSELGAPELAKYSCESDDIVYGDLPGIDFIRTQTLATGGTKCDFYLKLTDK